MQDTEGQLLAVKILQELLSKSTAIFEEQFARLGFAAKIAALAGSPEEKEEQGKQEEQGEGTPSGPAAPTQAPKQEEMETEDATELAVHMPYQWRDWMFVRSRDCLYIWNDYCSIELSSVSNGWFRFLLDSKLATMYSSGSTEGGPDSFGKGEGSRFLW